MKRVNFLSNAMRAWIRIAAMIVLLFTIDVGQMGAETYAIAGSMNSWSTTANKRTGTGAISITFSSTGNYTFKIVKDGAWCGNGGTMTRDNCSGWTFTYNGGDNCTISVDKTGTYTFTITNGTPTLSVTYPDATWSVAGGFNSWSTTANTFSSNKTSINLTNGTTYEFKVYRKEGAVYYGNSGTMTSANCSNWDFSSSAGNAKITANITGTYVFELVNQTPRITVHYPVAISYNKGTGGSGTISGGVKTYGVDYTLSSSTFTRSGYTQDGWATSDGGSKSYNLGGTYSTHTAQTFYPHWSANSYTVTFDKEGGSDGSDNATATYGSALPDINPPTKSGCLFAGYWDGDDGTGTLYYNANGKSARSWDKASATTLHAKWIVPPTGLSAASTTAKGTTFTVTDAQDLNDYEFYVSTSSTAPTSGTSATYTATSKSKTITNLYANTKFYAWVRAVSGGTKTGWTALTGSYFTTSTVTVTHTLTNVTKTSGATTAGGSTYTAVYSANMGYSMPTPSVTIGGAAATSGTHYTWTAGTGTITFAANKITGNIVVTLNSATTAPSSVTIGSNWLFFAGETLTLSVTVTGGNGPKTYQWYKGGTAVGNAISGATSATYSKTCAYTDAGDYYCKVTCGGSASKTSSAYTVKVPRLFVKTGRNGTDYGNVDFTRVDASTATASISLGSNWDYGFNVADGVGHYYGNTGTMNEANCTNWTMDNTSVDCLMRTTNSATYVFTMNYTTITAPVVSVTYPVGNQASGKVIYFDNQTVTWSNLHYRIGRTNHVQATSMTKVPGTNNLWKVTTAEYNTFSGWHIANNSGWVGSNSIYRTYTNGDSYSITYATAHEGAAVTQSAVTVTPTDSRGKGADKDLNDNCEFYNYSITSGMKTDRVTISSYSNGTITVNYVNTSNVASSFTSGYADLAHSVILTSITAVANTGYDASAITINGGAYSANYVVTGATTIAASFMPHVYSITYLDQGGAAFSGTHESGYPTTHTYNTATTLKSASKTGYEFGGWYTNSACTGDAVTSLGATAYTADITLYAKWTPVRLYFVTAGNWNNENNWSPKCVPTIEHDVTIQAPCSVDIPHAKAKSIVLDQNGKTGRLTIGANKGLEVTGTITKTTNGSTYGPTAPEDLVLESAAAGNASLIFNNSNGCQATVYMYSKAVGSGSTWNWQYVGTPFADTKASPNYNGSYLYHWNSASSTWEPVSNNDDIDPFTGYCITQSSATVLEMTGTLNASSDQEIIIPANSSCVVANSWTGPIFIRQLQNEDFGSMDKTVFLFNTGNDYDRNGTVDRESTAAGTYRAIPIHAASYLGDSVISSMQGFYVRNTTGSAQTLALSYANHVRPARATDAILNGAMYAPKRIQTAEPEVLKVTVQDSQRGATLYLLAREDFSRGYDDGWDGENINEAGAAPLLYSPRANGTKDAVSAIPDFEGAIVGFMTGEESEYTFSFAYNGNGKWYLNDLKNQTSTRIKAKNTYTFHPTGNDMKRFVISATPLAMVAASDPVVSVLVDGYPETEFDDFDDAWTVAMNAPAATVKLLADIERTESIVYRPKVDGANHTFDLNNHTVKENVQDRLLIIDKSDAKLTITDNSAEGNGCLYKQRECDTVLFLGTIYTGELIMAGGKLYLENTTELSADKWYPAITVHIGRSDGATFTMTGGTVEAQAKYQAIPVYSYGKIHISGGNIIANATEERAYGFLATAGVATISGGTFNVSASSLAYGAFASGWIMEDGTDVRSSVLNISGGTFNVVAYEKNASGLQVQGAGLNLNGNILTGQGVANVTGGTFNVICTAETATQVFGVQCAEWREFDNQTPHHLIGESFGEVNISGGEFNVDTRDNGAWVENEGNVDMLRSWGILNVTGGTFTIYQSTSAAGVASYRNKATVSGNPIFQIYCRSNARGVVASPWNSDNYCDADDAKNLAEIEVNGGTFYVNAEEKTATAVTSFGAISSSPDGGYAMSSLVTVLDGNFVTNTPENSRTFYQRAGTVGAYGKANRDIIVRGGKFMCLQGTGGGSNADAANSDMKELTGGYFNTFKDLPLHIADDHTLAELPETDPLYAYGFRYQVVPTSERLAKVKVDGEEKEFAMLQGALRYARQQTSPATVTLMKDALFYGPHTLAATVNENDITLDLNGNTVSAITATDRFLTLDKADMSFTITDRSTDQSGIWQMNATIDATAYGLLSSKGELRIAGGMIIIPSAGNKTTIAFATLSEDARLTISNGQITARHALLSKGGTITVTGGRFNTPTNVSGTATGTINLMGGYYISDAQLADYCEFPYEVLPTTDADKARVGDIYEFKISDESSERGIMLDIVDYTPSSITLNMNGFRTDDEPPYGWELEAFEKFYRSEDCASNKTLTLVLPEPLEAGATARISVRSQGGTIETSRFYAMPYIFEDDATLPEGDYSSSVLYVRSGTLTIDREVNVKKLIVCPEAEVDVTEGLLTADTVVLRSLPTRSAVIYGSFTVDKLYFTRIGPDGSESYPANTYHPFTLPLGYGSPVKDVRLSNGTTPAYSTSWVLRRNTGETEVKLTIDDIVESGKEYEIYSSLPYYREYYFPLSPMATGIENMLDGGAKARKLLINGEIRILINGQLYDLMGKRVQ